MDWRDAWRLTLGDNPPVDYPPHYIGSIFFFIITTIVGSSLRSINRAVTPDGLKGPIADFISTFQTCACSLENAHVLKHYGFPGLSVYLFVQCLTFITTYGDSQASPTGNFQRWFDGQLPVNNALFRIGLQILSAYASYKYALAVWAVDLLPEHKDKLVATECMTDLNVSLITGFGIETAATILDTWMSMQILLKSQSLDSSAKAAMQTIMIVLGLQLTGMYFNPCMASANTFGCKGTDVWEHIFVYWVGPFVGCLAAIYMDKTFHLSDSDSPAEKKTQ